METDNNNNNNNNNNNTYTITNTNNTKYDDADDKDNNKFYHTIGIQKCTITSIDDYKYPALLYSWLISRTVIGQFQVRK